MNFSAGHPEDIPEGKSKIKRRRKEVIFIELIFHTHRSPHIGSKLCSTKGTQLIGRFNVCTPESRGDVSSTDDLTLELPGSPEV